MKKVDNIRGMIGKTAVFLILLLCVFGCLRDVIPVLPPNTRGGYQSTPMRFVFDDPEFDPHSSPGEPENKIDEYVDGVVAFVFDQQTGILVQSTALNKVDAGDDAGKWKPDIVLDEGSYTIVVWGSNNEDALASYSALEADGSNNQINYKEPAASGKTLIDKFRLVLPINNLPTGAPDGLPGVVTPFINEFDDLYYSMKTGIEVHSEIAADTAEFKFQRNTHLLKVRVQGLEYLDRVKQQIGVGTPTPVSSTQQPINLFVLGRNSSYNYLNSVMTDSRDVRYEPMQQTTDGGINPWWDDHEMTAEIKIQRLELFNAVSRPVMLYLCDPVNNTTILTFNILEVLFANHIYTDQEDLDRQYELNVDVKIKTDGGLTVTINEWEIADLNPIIA